MQHKVSAPGMQIQGKRGTGCESVSAESPMSITGVVEGEYLMVYENKPSYKLIINSNGTKYRVSGYDNCQEGDTITCVKKDVELTGKKIYWYTMDNVPATPAKGKGNKKATA